jgi:hypothetical protein
MILLHENLPCSENYFRYLKNYDNYMVQKAKKDPSQKSPTNLDLNERGLLDILKGSPKSPLRSITIPKKSMGLSPIDNFF